MNVTSAAQKIQLKEEGHVLTKKYIDTLNSICEHVIDLHKEALSQYHLNFASIG